MLIAPPQSRTRVYIAGPYSAGNVAGNVRNAMQTWDRLFDAGFSPICPHLTHFLHLANPRPVEEWLEYDREWLFICDAVLRMPGMSRGADAEVSLAQERGIPVFRSTAGLLEHFRPSRRTAGAAPEPVLAR